RDGWYVTGDIARIDAEGFIHITDRASRFSKIGGEMVPHVRIEESLARIIGGDEEHQKAVVTAVPDAFRGERLVVVHLSLEKSPEQIAKELAAAGLPKLWIPSPDSFWQVEEIPTLGTGKLDLQALKKQAVEHFASN
ncbi:MAG TPA: acyl-[ACP]--phospholipid O-acyltransferase, partial [Pirellulales bacterium]